MTPCPFFALVNFFLTLTLAPLYLGLRVAGKCPVWLGGVWHLSLVWWGTGEGEP